MIKSLFPLAILFLFASSILAQNNLTGPYLGQKLPGMAPEIFAPRIVSTNADEYLLEISPSNNEIVFIRKNVIMLITRNSDGSWNMPSIAPFSGKYIDDEPCYSKDGNKIYFMSRRPLPSSKMASNLWYSERQNNNWNKPKPVLGIEYNKLLHAPSIAANGNIYDDGIVRFKYLNGKYLAVEKLTNIAGEFPFISSDESYIIFNKRLAGKNDADLYISFRKKDGNWSKEISLGSTINSSVTEGNAFVTADAKYLFFARKFDIYWVSAKVIEDLRPKE